jgi:threonyl-tRNA synthetase
MIDNVTSKDEAQMMRISEAHAHVMAQAIRLAFERALFELQKEANIDEGKAFLALEAAIPIAFETLIDG